MAGLRCVQAGGDKAAGGRERSAGYSGISAGAGRSGLDCRGSGRARGQARKTTWCFLTQPARSHIDEQLMEELKKHQSGGKTHEVRLCRRVDRADAVNAAGAF